jgi:hypothetical protein
LSQNWTVGNSTPTNLTINKGDLSAAFIRRRSASSWQRTLRLSEP